MRLGQQVMGGIIGGGLGTGAWVAAAHFTGYEAGFVAWIVGVLVGEFFAASEGIGYAIARFGDLYALDKMFACILTIMIIAVVLTEGVRWAERAAFPWRAGR